MLNYLKFGVAILLPPILGAIFILLQKKTKFGQLGKMSRQIIFGICFGGLAVLGTEAGIPINGAQMNCRDAAVLTAGLYFGAPAGIIAGIIGGVERWIAVAWGIGTFTRVGCSISTVIAGFYAAALRKFILKERKPEIALSFAIGMVMETFHLTTMFVTNMDNLSKAMDVVKSCAIPMIVANALSVMIAAITVRIVNGEQLFDRRKPVSIIMSLKSYLLLTIIFAFTITTLFVIRLQTATAQTHVSTMLSNVSFEVNKEVTSYVDELLINTCQVVGDEVDAESLNKFAKQYDLKEINLIDYEGNVIVSNNEKLNGFSMYSSRSSADFMDKIKKNGSYVQHSPIQETDSTIVTYAGMRFGRNYVQIGLERKQIHNLIQRVIKDITKFRRIETEGFALIYGDALNLVSSPGDGYDYRAQVVFSQGMPKENTMIRMNVASKDCYCLYTKGDGYSVLCAVPVEDAMSIMSLTVYANTFVEILVFALLYTLIFWVMRKIVLDKLDRVNVSLEKITAGDLDEVVDVKDNREFALLSEDINDTVSTLKRYIAEASARIDLELRNAKNIQVSALPVVRENITGRNDLQLDAFMLPAKAVGGDFYDFYMTDDNIFNFMIADVSGKGIPAAMFMMRSKTELRSLTENGLALTDVFTTGNNHLCQGNEEEMFVTAWQGRLDLDTGELTYVNAGHNHPLIYRNGRFEMLKSRPNFVLCGMPGMRYRCESIKLEPGNMMFMYTDGVTEATDANQELYGNDRLLAIANAKKYEKVTELIKAIKKDVDAFVGDAPQFDDITMLAIRYEKGNAEVVSL